MIETFIFEAHLFLSQTFDSIEIFTDIVGVYGLLKIYLRKLELIGLYFISHGLITLQQCLSSSD